MLLYAEPNDRIFLVRWRKQFAMIKLESESQRWAEAWRR